MLLNKRLLRTGALVATFMIVVVFFRAILFDRSVSAASLKKTRSMLVSNDRQKVAQALHFLAERDPQPSLRAEIEVLSEHEEPFIRFSVARVVQKFRDDESKRLLLELSKDEDPEVAEEAARGLLNVQRAIDISADL